MLGQATLFAGASDNIRVSAQKGFALLAYLAMHPGRAVSRPVLADLLWGDRGDGQARQNLRQSLLTLRRDLGPTYAGVLEADDQAIMIAPGAAEVDALEFVQWAAAAEPAVRARCLEIPWGPFLDGLIVGVEGFDDWALTERQRLDAVATRTFAKLAAQFDAAGDGERAILAMERLVAIDPGEEERHRRLLALEARYRGADAALARAKSLAALLKRDLDAAPEAATRALVEEIRRAAVAGAAVTIIGIKPASAAPKAPEEATGSEQPLGPVEAAAERLAPARTTRAIALAGALCLLVIGGLLLALTVGSVFERPDEAAARFADLRPDTSWQSPPLPSHSKGPAGDFGANGLVALAVMPFRDYSEAQASPEFFAEMITDDLTNTLARIEVFRVISRATSATYGSRDLDAAAVGSELGVRYLVEGNVSLRGDLLQVNAELIDARTRLQVWSGRFERAGADRQAILDDIVSGLGRELHIEVAAAERAQPATDPDIRLLIFKGWGAIGAVRRQGIEALRQAERDFTQALARDPENMPAQHGLAAVHTHMAAQLLVADPAPHIAKAEAILRKLIAQYPHTGHLYATLGLLRIAENRTKEALHAFERAIELNPSNVTSHAQIGRALVRLGRAQEGLEHIRYAIRLSPRDPNLPYVLGMAGSAELELGHFASAIRYLQRAQELYPWQPRSTQVFIAAEAMTGHLGEARQLLAQLQHKYPHLTPAMLRGYFSEPRRRHFVEAEGMLRVLDAP